LPHRTGRTALAMEEDEKLSATQAALVNLSSAAFAVIAEALVELLESLSTPLLNSARHSAHVQLSKQYIVGLLAHCCSFNWYSVSRMHDSDVTNSLTPSPLSEHIVNRLFDVLKQLLEPVAETPPAILYALLVQSLGHDVMEPQIFSSSRRTNHHFATLITGARLADVAATITVMQYITATSWSSSFTYARNIIVSSCHNSSVDTPSGFALPFQSPELLATFISRGLAFFWVDGPKLCLLMQEICSNYQHMDERCQNAVAVALPLLVMGWVERCPSQFTRLHLLQKSLHCDIEVLFNATQIELGKETKRPGLCTMQLGLALLLPDIFEAASSSGDAANIAQRKQFLDGLRRDMINGNEEATHCAVLLLHVARHFKASSVLVDFATNAMVDVGTVIFQQPSLDMPYCQEVVIGAFVSLAQLNMFSCIDSIFEICSKPRAPDTLRIAVVLACLYLAEETTFEDHDVLFHSAMPFMQSQFEGGSQRNEVELTRAILNFLLSCPKVLTDEVAHDSSGKGFLQPFLICVISTDSQVRRLATEIIAKLCAENTEESRVPQAARFPLARNILDDLWRQRQAQKAMAFFCPMLNNDSSEIVLDICGRIRKQRQTSEIQILRDFLAARLVLARALPVCRLFTSTSSMLTVPLCTQQPRNKLEDAPCVMDVSSMLETTLLTSLCTADIDVCQAVMSCINVLLEEESTFANHADHREYVHTLWCNKAFYKELASPSFRFTGLVAFQKRMHSLLSRMRSPTVGILAAWVEAFERWICLAQRISATSTTNAIDEKLLREWRNCSGFLASLSGICTAGKGEAVEELPDGNYPWIDRIHSERFEEPLLTIFLKVSVQLLGCSIVEVRESMRDVLSNEISSTLHSSLLQALESEFGAFFARIDILPDKEVRSGAIFIEQAAPLLKTIIEGASDFGGIMAVDLGLTAIKLARFLDSAPDEANTIRAKIRVCNMYEAVSKRQNHMNLRDDIRCRNQILECIFAWTTRPQRLTQCHGLPDVNQHIRKDLEKACLSCFAHLTFRLPLQPRGLCETGMSNRRSQMFLDYFSWFLYAFRDQTHQPGKAMPLVGPDARGEVVSDCRLLITILSNLLSANIDVGLRQCLTFGYHEDVEIRIGIVTVLYDILVQGTEFRLLSDSALSEKYGDLVNVLTTDESVPILMSAVCPASEVDELTMCLLIIFEGRGMLYNLFEVLLRQEIDQTENETQILRRTCVVTKLLSVFAKWKGHTYLRSTLQTLLERLMLTSHNLNFELDPARVGNEEQLRGNMTQLQLIAKMFVDDICASSENVPSSFRKICSIITKIVSSRFPNAKYTAVGAFVFLRFICPAIVAPESERLVSSMPTKEMRRGLLLIAKIIQNLANNVLFGTKEPYMFPLNPFLIQNIHLITGFLREITVLHDDIGTVSNSELLDFGSCIILHRFLYDNWDPIRQCLGYEDEMRRPAEPSHATSSSKPLLLLISKLGPPPLAISWNRPQIVFNPPPLYSRFQNFMLRNAFKGAESFITSRAVYDGGESKDGLSIVCIILRHIEDDRIDYNTLLYCYLKIASRLWHEPFGIFVDATYYKGRDEPSNGVFTMLELVAPAELPSSLSRIYVYNMNSAIRRYLRGLLRFSRRSGKSVFRPEHADYHFISNLSELRAHFNSKQLHLPVETASIVKDTRHVFRPVTRLSKSKGMIDVVIHVGNQFLRIATYAHKTSRERYSTLHSSIFGARITFSAAPRMICWLIVLVHSDLSIPMDPTRFVVNVSKRLARTEPHLTADFLTEFLVSWGSLPKEQKTVSLECLSPWLSNLRTNVLTHEVDGDRGREKVARLLRQVIELVLDHSLHHTLQHFVWPIIARDELILEIFLDELIKANVGSSSPDVGNDDSCPMSSIVISIGTVSLQGKLISRLWKAVNRSSLRLTRQLPGNAAWKEVRVLLRFCLALAFDNGGQSQMFLPEVFHLVTILSHTGGQDTRLLVHRFLVNTLHAIASSFTLQDAELSKLLVSVDLLLDVRENHAVSKDHGGRCPVFTQDSLSSLAATQSLVRLLMDTCVVAAPSVDMANAWRARWMSLVTSTAFQKNPAIQPRAFTAMGYLTCDEVDDDLLYQVLVALRNSLFRLADNGDGELLLAIVASLSRMVANLHCSRYDVQLFWLAIYLVQLLPLGLFNCIGRLLEATMNNIAVKGNITGEKLVTLLMQSRIQLADAGQKLDDAYGVHFTEENFHFAVCAALVRGFKDSTTRTTAVRVFSSFMKATIQTVDCPDTSSGCVAYGTPYLALTLARCGSKELDGLGWTKDLPDGISSLVASRGMTNMASPGDRDLLLMAVIELLDFQYLEHEAQTRTLRWMAQLSKSRSTVESYHK
ncbi:hypothetical protein CP533_3012, partial [Ophiocordyceps camponoti-saundersi (nom. inval.)]